MFHLPSRISRYEIKTLIGAGGMGSLYLARDTNPNTNRLVALKLLNATLDSVDLRERFAREARALAALNHPNIVDIYDSGEFQGSPYIVMEYVRGETLAEKIKRQAPMSLAQKMKLMVELCSGLAHAHDGGIIHRDIKPANLMVDQHGRLKILDFGIARMSEGGLTRAGLQVTQLNVRIGTPGYMSPEQIEGGEIDRRSDIFAVGAVCYELITYKEAFTGSNTRQIENKVLQVHPPPLSSVIADIDPDIEAIVGRALAKDPAKRYQDAASLEEAFDRQRWKLGPADTPVPVARHTPAPAPAGGRARDSRADAAFHRSLAVYDEGAYAAARRFAIEALAEDPDHMEARAFIERLGPNLWPPAPPASGERTGAGPTMLATGSHETDVFNPSAPTVLSTATPPSGVATRAQPAGVWNRHAKALQVIAILAVVLALVGGAVFLGYSLWPRGPMLTVTRPVGGTVWTSGITCGTGSNDCSANLPQGETFQLSAEADEGFVFTAFTGDCTSSGRVHMTAPRSCGATFSPVAKPVGPVMRSLTIVKPTNGTIVGPGIQCGSFGDACVAQIPQGTQVELRAMQDENFAFKGFTGDCLKNGRLVVTGTHTCGATFGPAPTTVKVTPPPGPREPAIPSARSGNRAGADAASPPVYVPPPITPGTGAPVDPGTLGTTTPGGESIPEGEPRVVPKPLAPEVLAKKDIEKVLKEYREAYEKLSVNAIKQVYPAAPNALQMQFRDLKALKFAYQGEPEFMDVDPSRGVARVRAEVRLTPTAKVGSQSPYQRLETFDLVLQSGIWVIQKVTMEAR